MSEFSVSATVGHASTHAPHETHSDARKGSFWLAATFDANPRPWIVSANVPCVSSQARTHREQAMHIVWSKVKYGLLVSFGSPWWLAPLRPYRVSVTSSSSAMSCSSQWPLAGQLTQSRGWSERYSSMTPRRSVVSLRALGPHLDPVADERRAGGGISTATFDFDETQTARSERLQRIGRAQLRDLPADGRGRPHDRRAFGHGDGHAVDLERDRLRSVDVRRAEIGIVS